jgi:hypothetical protein
MILVAMTRRACLALALAACGSPAAAPPAPPVTASTDRVPFSAGERAAELAFLRDAITTNGWRSMHGAQSSPPPAAMDRTGEARRHAGSRSPAV